MSQTEKIQTALPPARPLDHMPLEAVEDRHIPVDVEIGLGSDIASDVIRYAAGTNPEMTDREMYGKHVPEAAKAARHKLESLTPEQRDTVNDVFGSHPISGWIEEKIGVDESPTFFKNYVRALTAKNEETGEYAVGDAQLLNFLEWHNHSMVGEQAELDARAPEMKQEFADAFHDVVAKGWLPQTALANLERLGDARLLIDDGFYLTVHDTLGLAFDVQDERTGQYHVVFAPGEDRNRDTRFHELNHVAEGKAHVVLEHDGKEEVHTIGGVEQLFGWGIGGRALREAINAQFTDGMVHGRMQVLDPSARVRRHAAYPEARTMLYTLAEKGLKKIDFKLFLEAQYEDDVEAERLGGDSARARLNGELKEAFPFTDVPQEIIKLSAHEGEDPDDVLAVFAHNLAARAAKHRTLARRVAGTVLFGDTPAYIPRHQADRHEKNRGNSPAEIAARIREESQE